MALVPCDGSLQPTTYQPIGVCLKNGWSTDYYFISYNNNEGTFSMNACGDSTCNECSSFRTYTQSACNSGVMAEIYTETQIVYLYQSLVSVTYLNPGCNGTVVEISDYPTDCFPIPAGIALTLLLLPCIQTH